MVNRKGQELCIFLCVLCCVLWSSTSSAGQNPNQERISIFQVLRQYFETRNYNSGTVLIPELDTSIDLAAHQFFNKEEDLENIYDRLVEIRTEFGLNTLEANKVRGTGFCGLLKAECAGMEAAAYFILIRRGLNPESRIYTLGHEYGHFLWYLEHQELIFSRFDEPELIRSAVADSDDFAVLCGWAALKMSGRSLSQSVIKLSPNRKTMEHTSEIKRLVDLHFVK